MNPQLCLQKKSYRAKLVAFPSKSCVAPRFVVGLPQLWLNSVLNLGLLLQLSDDVKRLGLPSILEKRDKILLNSAAGANKSELPGYMQLTKAASRRRKAHHRFVHQTEMFGIPASVLLFGYNYQRNLEATHSVTIPKCWIFCAIFSEASRRISRRKSTILSLFILLAFIFLFTSNLISSFDAFDVFAASLLFLYFFTVSVCSLSHVTL